MSDETSVQPTGASRPDAVMVPMGVKQPLSRKLKQMNFVLGLCEKLLQADLTKGEKVGYRTQPTIGDGVYFAARVNEHFRFGLYFPVGHGMEGHDRYNWVPQPDGTRFGYLVPEARAEVEEFNAAR
jgi:hypothetical protein